LSTTVTAIVPTLTLLASNKLIVAVPLALPVIVRTSPLDKADGVVEVPT
jgi:hypothetical protein